MDAVKPFMIPADQAAITVPAKITQLLSAHLPGNTLPLILPPGAWVQVIR